VCCKRVYSDRVDVESVFVVVAWMWLSWEASLVCLIVLLHSTMSLVVPSGLLAVFKPKGMTSNDAVQIVKKVLNHPPNNAAPHANKNTNKIQFNKRKDLIKVGHGGTLDPLAEGVLVLGIGAGTKSLTQYLAGSKAYVATGLFGSQMNTLDCTGTVTATAKWDHVTHTMIRDLLATKYIGTFKQMPPMFSALKKDGKALYEVARKGIEIERETRPVTVYKSQLFPPQGSVSSLVLLPTASANSANNNEYPDDIWKGVPLPSFRLEVECGGGFYIRSLIDDLGKDCGSYAHMTALLRFVILEIFLSYVYGCLC
jgi:tRNA pseudouridine55 synthase